MRKFSTAVIVAAMLAVSGCGGGGSSPLSVKTSAGGSRMTVSGTVATPSGVSLSRAGARDASAMLGLVSPSNGTAVALYRIDEKGAPSGAALASGVISGGSFALALPAGINSISSDMVVVAGSGANAMRAFVVSTDALAVNPVSEYVVSMVAGRTTPMSEFTVAELADIYTRVAAKAAERGIDFTSSSSATAAWNSLYADTYIKQETANAVYSAEGSEYCAKNKDYCKDESSSAYGLGSQGDDGDAFGNIMHTSYIKIDSVSYATPTAGVPCAVTARLSFVGGEDEDVYPTVSQATLYYSVDGGAEQGVAMTNIADKNAWSANIPGLSKGKSVKFYVKALDSNGNTTTGAISSSTGITYGLADVDNSADVVPDDLDLLNTGVGYDGDRVYVGYSVQGKVSGGTIEPPYLQMYYIKISNPDIEQNEGLMVGKLWLNMPLLKESKTVQDKYLPLLLNGASSLSQNDIDKIKQSGMIVLDIGKLLAGNANEGILTAADPQGSPAGGGSFTGSIKRSVLGNNPSGMYRIITLTAVNASLDSFMPIPLNCSHFINLYTRSYGYTVQ